MARGVLYEISIAKKIDAYKDVYAALGINYKQCEKSESYRFIVDGKKLQHFDLKQMICHLLGIAKYQLENKDVQHKEVHFCYLTHKLTKTERDFLSEIQTLDEVENCIEAEQDEEKRIDKSLGWCNLYKRILKYQNEKFKSKKSEDEIDTMAKKFSFSMIDDQMCGYQTNKND